MLPTKFLGLSVQEEKRKINFQNSNHSGYLGFPIGVIFAIFNLLVTLMLPTKFQVKGPFGSEEKAKIRFLRWRQYDDY